MECRNRTHWTNWASNLYESNLLPWFDPVQYFLASKVLSWARWAVIYVNDGRHRLYWWLWARPMFATGWKVMDVLWTRWIDLVKAMLTNKIVFLKKIYLPYLLNLSNNPRIFPRDNRTIKGEQSEFNLICFHRISWGIWNAPLVVKFKRNKMFSTFLPGLMRLVQNV